LTEHVVPVRVYVTIFGVLMALTAVTVMVAFVDLGPLNSVMALTIAVLKATLVVLFFMHAKYSPRLTQLVIAGGLLWLVILLSLTFSDYLTRHLLTYG